MSESDRPLDEDGFLLAHEPAEEGRPDDRIDDERMDEENTFKPEFVRAVEDALEEGDTKAVYELVEPLHPADIADLLELLERQDQHAPQDLGNALFVAGTQVRDVLDHGRHVPHRAVRVLDVPSTFFYRLLLDIFVDV